MKKCQDTIRELLLHLEALPPERKRQTYQIGPVEGIDHDSVLLHLELLLDDGCIVGEPLRTMDGIEDFLVVRMTNKGYDFLDSIRERELWREVKNRTKSTSLEILKAVAKKVVLESL